MVDAWLNLVIKEGGPFCILDSPSMRTIAKPLFDALEISMTSSSSVSSEIKSRAEKLRQRISKMLSGKIISLKIDAASRYSRRVVCINAQAVIEGHITIQTLAMSEINRRHTGVNLRQYIHVNRIVCVSYFNY